MHGEIDAVWWNRVSFEAQEEKNKNVAARYIRNEIKAMQQGGAIERLEYSLTSSCGCSLWHNVSHAPTS